MGILEQRRRRRVLGVGERVDHLDEKDELLVGDNYGDKVKLGEGVDYWWNCSD